MEKNNFRVVLNGEYCAGADPDRVREKMAKLFNLTPEQVNTLFTGNRRVVKKNIEKLNGTIEIDSTTGKETRIRIKIPLTLAIIPALLVRVETELFTIPLSTVEETIKVNVGDIESIEGNEVIYLRNQTIPLIRLNRLFNMSSKNANNEKIFIVIVSNGMNQMGLVVARRSRFLEELDSRVYETWEVEGASSFDELGEYENSSEDAISLE